MKESVCDDIVHVSIFSVFQAVKPKSGVFCLLINEARETTALEMPDHENTFVLKVYHITCKNFLGGRRASGHI